MVATVDEDDARNAIHVGRVLATWERGCRTRGGRVARRVAALLIAVAPAARG